jgi:ATP:corrinoid adenosyltransferase
MNHEALKGVKSPFRDVICPTCLAQPGQMCGRQRRGASSQWERTKYHAARKQRYQRLVMDEINRAFEGEYE